jgi:hypothetical protein
LRSRSRSSAPASWLTNRIAAPVFFLFIGAALGPRRLRPGWRGPSLIQVSVGASLQPRWESSRGFLLFTVGAIAVAPLYGSATSSVRSVKLNASTTRPAAPPLAFGRNAGGGPKVIDNLRERIENG